jgi:hypothetical protein
MRKELTVYVNTNEEGEEVIVQRVTEDPDFLLLRLGQGRMVVNKAELLEAISSIEYYSAAFDNEKKMKEQKAKVEASRKNVTVVNIEKPKPVKKSASKEEEGTIIMDEDFTRGPTESELALKKKMEELLSNGDG